MMRKSRVAVAQGVMAACMSITAVLVAIDYPLNLPLDLEVQQYFLLALAIAGATASVRGNTPRITALVFWLFVYALFGIVQQVQFSTGQNPFGVWNSIGSINKQQEILLVGCFAFLLSSEWPRRGHASNEGRFARVVTVRRVVAMSLVSLLLFPLFYHELGGSAVLFSSREAINSEVVSAAGDVNTGVSVLRDAANALPFVALIGIVQLIRTRTVQLWRKPAWVTLFGLIILENLVVNNPISQPRYWIATVLIALATSGRALRSTATRILFVMAFLAMALVAFPYLDYFRNTGGYVNHRTVTGSYQSKTDYDVGQNVINGVDMVVEYGHTHGQQLLGTLLFWVPRSLWSTKPVNTAELIGNFLQWPNLNLDSPLWIEGYIDFGMAGTIVYLLLAGYAARRLDASISSGFSMLSLGGILAPTMAGYELILLRGSLLQAMARLSVVVLAMYLVTARRHVASPPSEVQQAGRERAGPPPDQSSALHVGNVAPAAAFERPSERVVGGEQT